MTSPSVEIIEPTKEVKLIETAYLPKGDEVVFKVFKSIQALRKALRIAPIPNLVRYQLTKKRTATFVASDGVKRKLEWVEL